MENSISGSVTKVTKVILLLIHNACKQKAKTKAKDFFRLSNIYKAGNGKHQFRYKSTLLT